MGGSCPIFLLKSPAHVQSDEACLVQPLPQSHFQPEVMVDIEADWMVVVVVVVVRVLYVVWGHEAVCAHLQQHTHTQRESQNKHILQMPQME